MKNILTALFIFAIISKSLLFISCSDNKPTNPNDPGTGTGTFGGEWTVDHVKLLQAPPGNSTSALMKQALVHFGGVSGSFVGYLDVKFGVEHMEFIPSNLTSSITKLRFKGNVGLASSYNFIQISQDAGNSWNNLNVPSQAFTNTHSFYLSDENNIFLKSFFNNKTYIAKSTNRGITWDTLSSNTNFPNWNYYYNIPLDNFVFTNYFTGYTLLQNGSFYKSTDGGKNWVLLKTFDDFHFFGMKFFDDNNGIVINSSYQQGSVKVWKTNDGGITWNSYLVSNLAGYVLSAFYLNSNIGYLSVNENTGRALYRTNNGGVSWIKVNSDIDLTNLCFINETVGYANSRDVVLKTVNGGSSWAPISTSRIISLYDIVNLNGQPVVFVNNGMIKQLSTSVNPLKWTARGNITNTAIQIITQARNSETFVNGEYYSDVTTVVFTVNNYSNEGGQDRIGVGTFAFENSNTLNITLNLANNEKWEIKLKRR